MPVDTTLQTWAEALSDARLALDLARLAGNVRFYAADQRRAILEEAARRLTTAGARELSLADGLETLGLGDRVTIRTRPASSHRGQEYTGEIVELVQGVEHADGPRRILRVLLCCHPGAGVPDVEVKVHEIVGLERGGRWYR